VTATAISGSQATVSWTAPATNGGAPVTSYTVTASPGGATCTTTTLSCDITGLSSGVTYSYSVAAMNAIGTSTVRSTTVTYVPPAPTPTPPANTVSSSGGTPVLTLARSGDLVTEVDEKSQTEVPVEVAEETVDDPTTNPLAERNSSGDPDTAESAIVLGVAGGLFGLALLGLLVVFVRRRVKL
jgi:hypothetical protein